MKQLVQHPQQMLAKAFLLLFPFSTILIYREPYINGFKWEYGTLAYYGVEILGWLTIASVVIALITHGRASRAPFGWTRDRLFVSSLAVLALYGYASAAWAVDGALAQQQSLRVLFVMLIFLSLPMVLTRKQIVTHLALGALLPMGVGLYQFVSQTMPGSVLLGMSPRDVADPGVSVVQFGDERWLRAYGTFAHPNIFGGFLALVTMLVLSFRNQLTHRYWNMWLLLSGVLLVLTMSRSAWIAITLGGVFIWYRNRKMVWNSLLVLFGSMLAVALLLWPLTATRLGVTSYHEQVSISERNALQAKAGELVSEHVIFGVGAGNMTAALITIDNTKFGYAYQPVHNVPTLLFVEYGVVGLLLLVVSIGIFLYWKRETTSKNDLLFVLAHGVVLLPILLFDHYMFTTVHGLGIGAIYLSTLALSADLPRENDEIVA